MNHELSYDGITSENWKKLKSKEIAPGIFERTVWQSEAGKKAVVLEFSAGASYPAHTHEPGPEQIYVISGVFNDGRSDHDEGSFIHNPVGSAHIPQSKTGCTVLVTFPGN